MAIALCLLGLLDIAYGVTVTTLNSGTLFFAVWYALGIAFLVAAWATYVGAWAAVPLLVRRLGMALLLALLIVLGGAAGMVCTGLGAAGKPDLDYVVVLGAQIYDDGSPSPVLRYRLDAALAYLQENPRTRCIVSGGKGPNEPYAEARGMAAYLRAHGVDEERLIEEGRSTNTMQNVTYSMALMDAPDSRVGIVTNNFHVYRAVRIARKAGLHNACGIAGYSTPWYLPNNLLRECLGLVKDTIAGNV